MGVLELMLTSGVALAALDRLSKGAVTRRLPPGRGVHLGPGLRLQHVRHRLNPAVTKRQGLRLIALLMACAVVLIWRIAEWPVQSTSLASVGIAVALAGASCNLWDRLRRRAIVDFICIGPWPPFNIADVGICVGAALVLSQLG